MSDDISRDRVALLLAEEVERLEADLHEARVLLREIYANSSDRLLSGQIARFLNRTAPVEGKK